MPRELESTGCNCAAHFCHRSRSSKMHAILPYRPNALFHTLLPSVIAWLPPDSPAGCSPLGSSP